jgi:hypothetical protein
LRTWGSVIDVCTFMIDDKLAVTTLPSIQQQQQQQQQQHIDIPSNSFTPANASIALIDVASLAHRHFHRTHETAIMQTTGGRTTSHGRYSQTSKSQEEGHAYNGCVNHSFETCSRSSRVLSFAPLPCDFVCKLPSDDVCGFHRVHVCALTFVQ